MKFGLFIYKHSHNNLINIGDYVQSIAARQFLPHIDKEIERDGLKQYTDDSVKLIMNGWFGYNPENWPPSNKIKPLFVSFHLNKNISDALMNNKKVVEYLKKNEPIGCRDYNTAKRMKAKGIDAYFSCCLTTTLNYDGNLFKNNIEKTNTILLVDILFKENISLKIKRNKLYFFKELLNGNILKFNKINNYIHSLIPEKNKKETKNLTCYYPANSSQYERFQSALDLLKELASAKVVVTSRIHIALPCLALGTPVLFVIGDKLSNPDEFKRLDGIVDHMNILIEEDFDTTMPHLKNMNFFYKSGIDWNNPPKNPISHEKFRDKLIKRVTDFIEK
ncbi:polysaccharide pyruvyl transferase family protein [Psychroflexus lacisalsi]|uniref:Polysaccharide pyruvyl transferase domain-containing protein n=1 Tax=Psychroflexus lacisalsi TaxID=503928 RepID=A0ABN1K059_9FLAO|nr:polysaccharide pyruvyl transferase family protein [Psychroflexus lacisalsi]MBZ9620998.1 polysaccharide pyruvyl transferase family protein [Psychroflexus lacisalsi]